MIRRVMRHDFSLLHVDYVKLNKQWNYTDVISPYYRIYYIDEGEGYVTYAKEKVKLEPGYLYLIPSFTLCNLRCDDYLSQYYIHIFEESAEGISLFENNRAVFKVLANEIDIANITRLLANNPGRGINRSYNPKVYEKSVYYKSYQELNSNSCIAVYIDNQGIIFQLIARFLFSNQFIAKNSGSVPSKILDTISFIQLHMKDKLTVELLGKRANLQQDYFSRLFLQYTGERPLAYIHEKRIERAQYLMATTDLSYFEIAEQTGFDSLPHFSKIFKKITRITPAVYKKQNQLFYPNQYINTEATAIAGQQIA